MRSFIFCLFLLFMVVLKSQAQNLGSMTDPRDGQVYDIVTYTFTGINEGLVDTDEYNTYVRKNTSVYELKIPPVMSLTMTWMAQNLNFESDDSKCYNASDPDCKTYGRGYTWHKAKQACPEGWRLPNDDDWFLLAHLYGGVSNAGQHLKSSAFNGTGKSNFNVSKSSIYWSSSELDADNAFDWKLNYRWTKLQRWKGGKAAYNLVRCVKCKE